MRNPVGISMKKDEIVIRISEGATQKETVECLNKKIPALKKLYKSEKTPICVVGKVLKNKEIEEIRQIINKDIDVQVTFDSPKVLGLHGIKKAFNKEIESSDTKFFRGSVRSGQRLEHEGSIVVLGDVNAGAEVVAGDNVVVVGVLRGLAHAGAKGNKNAIIAAASIDCKQIRIANIIKEIEEQYDEEGNIVSHERKTYASVEDDKIILE